MDNSSGQSQHPYKADEFTLYKRSLPCPPALSFSSKEGKQIFSEALLEGSMEGFFPLIEQFCTQDEPAFCGLASLAMVLNTLDIDPKRPWKGPWRWFHERMLDCCKPLQDVMLTGIDLDQAACLARCNGATADIVRYPEVTQHQFRQEIARACRSPKEHLIVSYTRKSFQQTGDGHFSPVGGYHAGRDVVLILDVARFKYPPHWVPLELLHEAMSFHDPATQRSRGYLRLGASRQPSSVLFTLQLSARDWESVHEASTTTSEALSNASADEDALLRILQQPALEELASCIGVRRKCLEGCDSSGSCVQPSSVEQLLSELHISSTYALLASKEGAKHDEELKGPYLCEKGPYLRERRCLALLMISLSKQSEPSEGIKRLLAVNTRHEVLMAELAYLVSQYQELPGLWQKDRLESAQCVPG